MVICITIVKNYEIRYITNGKIIFNPLRYFFCWHSVGSGGVFDENKVLKDQKFQLLSTPKLTEEYKGLPLELMELMLEDIIKDRGACEGKQATIKDYDFDTEFVDLNNDSDKEIIIEANQICDDYLPGVRGGLPIYIYQKINEKWKKIGGGGIDNTNDFIFGEYEILDRETDLYKDIVVRNNIGGGFYANTIHKWNESKLNYETISSDSFNNDALIDESGKIYDENDTEIWNRYANYKYGFEFKYPINLYITSESETKNIIDLSEYESNPPEREYPGIRIQIDNFSDDFKKYIDKWADDNLSNDIFDCNLSATGITKEEVKIDGASGVKFKGFCGFAHSNVFIVKNKQLFLISDSYGNDKLFDQILSTFQFTKSKNETGIPDFDYTIDVKQEAMPHDLSLFFVEDFVGADFDQFCGQKQSTISDFELVSESIDLNTDGIEEFIITPGKICGEAIRGASGNGPILIYQMIGNSWKNIGNLKGNMYAVKRENGDDYQKVVTWWHESAVSGTVTYYTWNKSKLSYEQENSKEVNLDNN